MREDSDVVCNLGNGLALGRQGAGGGIGSSAGEYKNDDDPLPLQRNWHGNVYVSKQLARAVRIRPRRRALS